MTFPRVNGWTAAVAAFAAVAAVFLGCTGDYRRPSGFRHLTDLDRPDCRIGVFLGTGAELVAPKFFPNARIVAFDELEDASAALLGGHLEAFIGAEHVLSVCCRAYPDRFRLMDEPLERQPYHVVLAARNAKLQEEVNRFIATYRKDGTYDDMFARWCLADEYVPMPKIAEAAGGNGTLRVGTSGLIEPSTFVDESGALTGYDVEFALRLGRALDRKVKFVLRPDGDFEDELLGGNVDLVINNCNSPECPKGLAYSDGYLDSDKKVLIVEAQPGLAGRAQSKMLDGTRIGRSLAFIPDPRARLFLGGFVNTVAITFLAALVGFVLAQLMRRVERRLPRMAFYTFDGFLRCVRATPPLVILLLFHGALMVWAPTWSTAVVAFGFWFAAYLESVVGGGPAAWLPVMRLRLPVLLQWTSVVGYVSVIDLAMAADLLCGRSVRAFVPLLTVAAAYVLIAFVLDRLGAWAERKLSS